MPEVVCSAASVSLAHTPGLTRHGSKPTRELHRDAAQAERFLASLRSFEEAVGYPPNQAFLGALHPRELPERPWVGAHLPGAKRTGPFGELMPEEEFLGLLTAVDEFDLVTLDGDVAERAAKALADHPLSAHFDLDRVTEATAPVDEAAAAPGALPLYDRTGALVGAAQRAHPEDESLTASVLLENLACKATGTLALLHLLHDRGLDPTSVDYTISCSEEAVGDRYQRGGGNMAKAIAGVAGLTASSGADVKDFCAAPIPALVMAASLVSAGVCERVAVVAGGSLPKLGMKFEGHLKHDLPVLEDSMAGAALLVTADDGASPRVRLDAVGKHRVDSGGASAQILADLATKPLDTLGLAMTEVDDYATELHDPEVTEPQGSGDVADRNYRTLAALASRRGDITREEIDAFAATHGMPGYAPTQGHLASALCYVPHALERLTAGPAQRVQLLAKGSLFLGRMSQDSDGMSVLLERNGGV